MKKNLFSLFLLILLTVTANAKSNSNLIKSKKIEGFEKVAKESKSNKSFESYVVFASCGAFIVSTQPGVTLNSFDLIVVTRWVEDNICNPIFLPF